jgi:hypothetical protein
VIEDLDAVLFLSQEKILKEIDARGTMRVNGGAWFLTLEDLE